MAGEELCGVSRGELLDVLQVDEERGPFACLSVIPRTVSLNEYLGLRWPVACPTVVNHL